ncbi:uncharacterized protein TNCV_5066141 [Trichonephila clavipes]|nr:uncharacterized protein TNCV_5066141 [Trichonephila clavipes]
MLLKDDIDLNSALKCVPSSATQNLEIKVALNVCCKVRERYLRATLNVLSLSHFSGVKPQLIRGRSGDPLCFLIKADSALVPEMAISWSEGGQGNACNKTVCDLDTLDHESPDLVWGTISYDSRSTLKVLNLSATLNLPARLPIRFPIEHVWDIIGRPLQHHL